MPELDEALCFLRDAREQPALAAAGAAGTLDDAVAAARAAGYAVSSDALRRAHRIDWGMRVARHAAPTPPSRS